MKIKIRAYDKKNKCFVKDLHNIRVRKNGEIYSQNKDIEFNLFTGLFDKNEMPVYENDILLADNGNLFIVENAMDIEGKFILRQIQDVALPKSISFHSYNVNTKIIMGNIYEDEILLLIKNHELT